jgi:hypothetical protein
VRSAIRVDQELFMSLEIHPDIMAMGAVILVAGGALIARRGLGAVLSALLVGGPREQAAMMRFAKKWYVSGRNR